MASQGTGYDLSASTYSPDGRIFQIEYANKAVENAGTVIGLKCTDGIVLAVEKLIPSKLQVPGPKSGSNRRIYNIDRHAGIATAGLVADGKHLANRARDEASNFEDTYKYKAPIQVIADRLASYIQAFTLYSSVRPFGVSAIVAGIDEDGPAMYMIDPSGTHWGYHGCAVGKGRSVARTEIEKLDLKNLKTADAVQHAANIIYKVHDDAKDKDFEMELSWICPESKGKHELVPADLVAEAGRKAKELLDDEMED